MQSEDLESVASEHVSCLSCMNHLWGHIFFTNNRMQTKILSTTVVTVANSCRLLICQICLKSVLCLQRINGERLLDFINAHGTQRH